MKKAVASKKNMYLFWLIPHKINNLKWFKSYDKQFWIKEHFNLDETQHKILLPLAY